ncbi:MAG: hypothetical protein K6T28_05495 [Acidothermus sp.]|nr:hypothetical protein [Acidothermus sp.]
MSFFHWALVFFGLFVDSGAVFALLALRLFRGVKALAGDAARLAARLAAVETPRSQR